MCLAEDQGCEPGWQRHGDYCYYASDSSREYDIANADCVSRGSTLASIHSQEENDFIRGKFMH